jgi:F-type H+-transporting ATPase subunit a
LTIYDPLHHLGVPVVVQSTALAFFLLATAGLLVRRQLSTADGGVLPDDGISIRNIFEVIIENLAQIAKDNLGEEHWKTYFPIVGTIFFFILISNLLGLIPAFGGATSYVETTVAWAIISVVLAEAVGIKEHGVHYVKHFLGPIWWLAPFFFILEVPLHAARIVTLAIRLLANMFADHTIVAVWLTLVPILVPAVFMGLGMVIAFLQAFVFALLTMVYIGQALEEAH